MSRLESDVAASLAEILTEVLDRGGRVTFGDSDAAELADADWAEGERELGLLLTDGRSVEISIRETAPRPGRRL